MSILDDVIASPDLDANVKKILRDNIKYAKGGATGPDMFYFGNVFANRFADMAHYCSPGDLAKKMLEMAKKSGKPEDLAFAYGWIIHVMSDIKGHPWVNSLAGGEYNPNNPAIKKAHRDIEQSIDLYNFLNKATMAYDENGIPSYQYDTDLASPNGFLDRVYREAFGCKANAPDILTGFDAEAKAQIIYNVEPVWIQITKKPDTYVNEEYAYSYQQSISEAINALNLDGSSLKNWDLDSGISSDEENYTGDIKCAENGKLQKCSQTPKPASPGGDHPDDTVSVDGGSNNSGNVSKDDLYRFAAKKNKRWTLWQKAVETANIEYAALPATGTPSVRKEKLAKLSKLVEQLNDPFNYREFSINNPQFEMEALELPDVAVLENGFYEEMMTLVNRHKEPARIITTLSPDIYKEQPIFVIPSGGLYGMENSIFLKLELDEYVKQGGTLIIFAQQHGYEFNILPVPMEADGTSKIIKGYGWGEDQSCFTNAVYIDTQHQMLASLSNAAPTLSVDGYFTSYPSNTTVLLRRTANGQPSMIMYEHGLGRVIVSSMYSDFAMSHNQASQEELSLVRDMVSWAKKPDSLPEIRPGQTVDLTTEIKNSADIAAALVKLYVYNPDRATVVSNQVSAVSIPVGQSASIPIAYTSTLASALGIYHIDYELYDANGNIIQPRSETDSGRFVISNPPPSNPYKSSDFNFVVNSDSENYAYGSDAVFTLTFFNNTNTDRIITAKYIFPHHLSLTKDLQYGNSLTKVVTVPAKGSASFVHTLRNAQTVDRLWAFFFDEDGQQVGMASRGFYVFQPKLDVTVTSDKARYLAGETVNLLLNLKNIQTIGYTSTVKVRVTDPRNSLVYENSLNISMPPGGSVSQSLNFNLPATALFGFYTATVEAYDAQENKIGGDSRSFDVPSALLSIKPLLPVSYSANSSFSAAFEVSNIEIRDVLNASIRVIYTDPRGAVLFEGIQPLNIAAGQKATFAYDIPTGPFVFADYILKCIVQYGDKVALVEKKLKRDFTVQYRPGKPAYAAGESLDFTLNVYNNGVFVDNLQFAVNVPVPGFTRNDSISLLPGQSIDLLYSIPIPTSVLSGKYSISAELFQDITNSFYFQIPDPKLIISLPPVATAQAGETLTISLRNEGGGAADRNLSVELRDVRGLSMQKVISSGILNAGSGITTSLVVPAGVVSGPYMLLATATDRNSPAGDLKSAQLNITGVSANLSVQTEKTSYIGTEGINGYADITSTGKSIANASLELKVVPALTTGTLRGTVINSATGIGIGGAKISVGDNVTYSTSSGQYLLAGIPVGPQRVTMVSPGFDKMYADINIIEAGQTFDAILAASTYGTFRGILKDSQSGNILVGAKVEVKPKDVLSEEQVTRRISSGFDGRFAVNKIAIGIYTLRFIKEGYDTLDTEITILQAANETQFLLTKKPVPEPVPAKGELSGRIINRATGAVLTAGEIKLDTAGSDFIPQNEKMYHFYNIAPGQHTLSISKPGYDSFTTTLDITVGKQSYDIYLDLSVYGNLSGTIRAASSGNTVSGAKIEISPLLSVTSSDRLSKILHSDFDGKYSLNRFPVGTYSVRVTKQYYTEVNSTVTIAEGTSIYDMNLQLAEPVPAMNEIEPNNALSQATFLPVDAIGTGTIYPAGENDYYKITIPAPGTIKVTVSDIPAGTSLFANIYNESGVLLSSTGSVASPGPAVLSYFAAAGGNYNVLVSGGSSTSPYRIKTEFVPNSLPAEQVLFTKTILPVDLSGPQRLSTVIPAISAPGKYLLKGTLKSNTSQTIAGSVYPFYIVSGKVALHIGLDKKIYKKGEPVTIAGEVRNLSPVAVSGTTLSISINGQSIHSEHLNLPANASHPITVSLTAAAEGFFTLNGKLTQNSATLAEISENYEVAIPLLTATVSVPEVAGADPFNTSMELKNTGKVEATVHYDIMSQGFSDAQTVIIPAGETRLINYLRQITGNTTYTFTFTGDLNESVTKAVSYGLDATIELNPQQVYQEGRIGIPVTITNTGLLDETISVDFSIQSGLSSQTKAYYLPKGSSTNDTIYADLAEGNYQLTALSNLPLANAAANFAVRKVNKVAVSVSAGSQTDAYIPVRANISNLGYNSISGSVRLLMSNSEGTTVWTGTQDVLSILSQNSQSINFTINVSTVPAGAYNLKVEFLDSANQKLAEQTTSLAVQAATFTIAQLPAYRIFNPGDAASFEFRVKNTGNQAGPVELGFKAYDAAESVKREWLAAGEDKSFVFNMAMPSDLEAKDYFADYELNTGDGQQALTKGQVKYHLAGINLNVTASLDKQTFAVGDTAHLTIAVSDQQSAVSRNLFARVNYAGFEDQKTFTLNGSQILTFDIPLSQITGEKLFYGIYYESGRSIHLNSLYIYKAGDVITITTNKQVYSPGETALVSVTGSTSGNLALTAPGYSETFAFSGTASKSFALPQTMTAGTYGIIAELSAADGNSYAESHSIDIAGIKVKVLECKNDRGKYMASDTITTELTVSSNSTMPAVLKTWTVDPSGKYTAAGETGINLNATDNALVSSNSAVLTSVSGIHRLVYGIYSGDLLLVSGSEAFDVGDAVLLGLKTDKTDYPTNTESVKATASTYGSVQATMELQLDGAMVKNESVFLDGFSALEIDLGSVTPGPHILKGILTAGGLKSTKETSFVYGSNLPDLTAAISYQQSAITNDNTVEITATATNQGRTAAAATTIAIYDGDSLIETKQVNALNSGETQKIAFVWNVLGKTGSRILKAVVDPDNTVIEFNETNNTAIVNLEIPDLTLMTGTDKDTYKINQNIQISSIIRNLSSEKTFSNLTLITTAKEPLGNDVYTSTAVLTDIQPLGTKTDSALWNTTGLTSEGTYFISQKLFADSQVLAQGTKTVTVIKASDFSMSTISDHMSVRQGEQVIFTVNLTPLNGWVSPIMLSLTGLPAGTSVSLNPGNLVPPGQALIEITTSNTTPAGSYTLTLASDGTNDGEHMTHTLPLTLEVSDATPPSGRILINNGDAFTENTAVTLNLHATDESGVAKMCISNSGYCTGWENHATTRAWTLNSGEGIKTVYVWYQDSVGNINAMPYTASITLDTTAPSLTVSTLADGRWTNNELLNISGEATDQSGIRELTINGVAVTVNPDGTFGCPVLLADGPNTIITKASDLAGNETSDTRTITLDRSRPNITILTPADNMKTNQPAINVTGTVDETSTVSIRVDDSTPVAALMDGNSFSQTVTSHYGINTIEATATDFAGNSSTAKRTVTFDDIKPLLSVIDPTQDVKTNQANMTVKGEVQDLTFMAVTVSMDGTTYSPVVNNGRFEQPVTFSQQMTYQINVEAIDEAGNVSSVQRHVLYDTTGPVVTLNPVTSPTSLTNQVLTGSMEIGSTVSVLCSTATVSAVTYPTATTWTATLSSMQQGNNDITITAIDEVGNAGMPVSATISVSTGNAITNTSPARLWIGLKNSDDQGTQFDLRAELYINGTLVSFGETLCITGVTRNATLAKDVAVPFAPISGGAYSSGDTLSMRILTRIGTTPSGLKCSGPGGSHNNAVGLRMYYDSADRPSRFGAEIVPNPTQDLFLHSSGTNYFLNNATPTGAVKYKDSVGISYNNGNPWKEIGTWTLQLH